MTYGAFTPQDFAPFDDVVRSSKPVPQAVLCGVALVLSSSIGLWALYAGPSAAPAAQPETQNAALPAAIPPLRRDVALLEPTPAGTQTTVAFAQSAPLRPTALRLRQDADDIATPTPVAAPAPLVPSPIVVAAAPPIVLPQAVPPQVVLPQVVLPPVETAPPVVSALVETIPLPLPRPADLSPRTRPASSDRVARQGIEAPAPTTPADRPSFFDRLFKPQQTPGNTVLAYATPEDGVVAPQGDPLGRPLPYDHWTAVYVISTHTVYLPDGTKLEAHSGLGSRLDDPRSVAERMRGATPPNVYDLAPREALFHGVRALRLTPAGGTTYGRGGLLAHTFMLGPRGDSNGCVVFRDYKAFLQAYDSGTVRRLAVVARMN